MKQENTQHHLHCTKCGLVLEETGRMGYISPQGVTILYLCTCGVLEVIYENKKGKIIEI